MDRPEEPIRCSECKREPREDENPDDEWRAVSDGVGDLHIFCPGRAEERAHVVLMSASGSNGR